MNYRILSADSIIKSVLYSGNGEEEQMKLNDFMTVLKGISLKHGDIDVVVNGEHGAEDLELLSYRAIKVGTAALDIPEHLDLGIEQGDMVLTIGGI